jgi:hypothetical protein
MILMATVTSSKINGETVATADGGGGRGSTDQVLAGVFDEATIAGLAEAARAQGVLGGAQDEDEWVPVRC